MITTIYTCDRCNNNVRPEQLNRVSVDIKLHNGVAHNTPPCSIGVIHWCNDCLTQLKVFETNPDLASPTPKVVPAITFEDLIHEIVHDAINQRP